MCYSLTFIISMNWSSKQRAFAVEMFIKAESVTSVQRAFRIHFQLGLNDPVPTRPTILQWTKNFRITGSTLKKKVNERRRNVRTHENIEAVRQSVLQSPTRSSRKHASALRLSDRSVRRILHTDLKFHPYKIMVVQKLYEHDYEKRKACCLNILQHVSSNDILLTSDEAHFNLSGYVNKQNFRYWSTTNPMQLHEKPLHSERVTVWCAISHVGVWGPYFFEEEDKTVTVTSDRYVNMLQNFLKPKIKDLEHHNVWFQQDGATAHTAGSSMKILKEMIPGRLISLRGDIAWSACSPDLAPCDYFLWGYLKDKVYICK